MSKLENTALQTRLRLDEVASKPRGGACGAVASRPHKASCGVDQRPRLAFYNLPAGIPMADRLIRWVSNQTEDGYQYCGTP